MPHLHLSSEQLEELAQLERAMKQVAEPLLL